MVIRRWLTATVLSLVTLLSGCETQEAEPSDPPNIVLIITDDQGRGDFGYMGNPVLETPHLDGMAARSASMSRYYVSPVCAPTRANLMTGRYNYRTRAIDTYIGRAMMDTEEVTVAELLGDAGYRTSLSGKWHLGDSHPMRPQDQGFQEVLMHRGGGIGQPSDPRHHDEKYKYTNPDLFLNGEQKSFEGYCTDIYFDHAFEAMSAASSADEPFFAYIPTNAPHGPYDDVPEELYQKYKAMDLSPVNIDGDPDRLARIFAMIENIDANVGRLFAHLESIGELDNTLVMFTLDNGPNSRRFVGDVRGMKSEVFEGGIRSPLLMHWPDQLTANTTSDRVAAHYDVAPTILDAVGLDIPPSMDGRSLLPLLTEDQPEWPDRTIYIQTHRGNEPIRYHHFAAIEQDYKLVRPSGFGSETLDDSKPFFLYNISLDPGETNDLAAQDTDRLEAMKTAYDAWFDDVSSTRDDNYAPPRISVGHQDEPTVTLTRQDWRHFKGRPWAPNSNGKWLVDVTEAGDYDVEVWLVANEGPSSLTFTAGSSSVATRLEAGVKSHRFESLSLEAGPAEIETTMDTGGDQLGAWQVAISRKE